MGALCRPGCEPADFIRDHEHATLIGDCRTQNGPEMERFQARLFHGGFPPRPFSIRDEVQGSTTLVSSIRGDALRRDETPKAEKQMPEGVVLVDRHGA